jgi:Protein of unknown function (DUF2939)
VKRFTLAVLVFTVLLVGYWAWPFVGLRTLAAALQAHNAAALSEQVDFPRLRSSLAQQIIFAYLRVTGRESKLGAFAPIASNVGASLVDPLVSQIINPENLIELLRGGTIESELGATSFNIGIFPHFSLSDAWDVWLGSEYGLGRVSIGLPANAEAVEQFRLRMQLLQWRWKITGLDLPQKLRDQLARELAKKYP